MFTPVLECPKKDDRYFIQKSAGGLNPCIAKPAGSPLLFANCVFFVVGIFAKRYGVWFPSTNAENFVTEAKKLGLQISQTPQLGAIACWAKGKVGDGSDGAGHVASVEIINNSGSIVTAESGWGSAKGFWTQTRKPDGNWGQSSAYRFLGFILPPASSITVLCKGDRGEQVKRMQTELAARGYLRKSEIDGDFGRITLGAVCAFQLENGLEVDGICGPKTAAALSI